MPRGRPRKQMDIQEATNEATPEVKPVVKEEVPQSQPVNRTLTAEEAALKSILEEKDDSWLGLTDKDIEDFSLAEDPFKLPKEAKKLQDEKKYAFRWCENKIKRVMELRNLEVPFRWSIANGLNTPELARYVDGVTGGIHNRDQILLYKPFDMHMKAQSLKNALDDERYRTRDPKNRDGERDGAYRYASNDKARITDKDTVVFDDESFDTGEMSIEA